MITEVENIILNKEYFELTAEELSSVGDLVQNAEEYDEMKWFLASTQQALVSEKIEATPELKKSVMEYLNQDEKKRRFWLNGVGVFLFPEDKRFYQKPAFQMSLAALLLIGFLMVYNRPVDEGNMALNDTTIEDTELTKVEESVDTRDDGIELDATTEQPISDIGLLEDEVSSGKADDVLVNRSLASGAGALPAISLAEELDVLTDVSHPDGVYGEPFDEDAEEISMEDSFTSFDDQDNNSKTNANNNEGNKVLPVTIDGNNKQTDKMSRDQSKKGELKDDKDKRSKNKDGKYRKSKQDSFAKVANEPDDIVTGADVDLNNNENNSGNSNNTGGLNQNGYNSTNELGKENANSISLGGATGNVTNTSQPGNNQTVVETSSTIERKDLVEKEQNEIMPYQQHVNDTQELKSLFKTFK